MLKNPFINFGVALFSFNFWIAAGALLTASTKPTFLSMLLACNIGLFAIVSLGWLCIACMILAERR